MAAYDLALERKGAPRCARQAPEGDREAPDIQCHRSGHFIVYQAGRICRARASRYQPAARKVQEPSSFAANGPRFPQPKQMKNGRGAE
jgi:hypothetical protein